MKIPVPSLAPATDKQVEFIRRLIRERDVYPNIPAAEALSRLEARVAEGVLMKVDASRIIDRMLTCPRRVAPAVSAEPEAGIYRRPDGTLIRVYLGQQSGRMLAKQIVAMRICEGHESLRGDMMGVTDYCDGSCRPMSEATYSLEYLGQAVRHLDGAVPLTLEEAKAWGKATSTCCVCARRLDVPESVDAGIGPKCAGSFR